MASSETLSGSEGKEQAAMMCQLCENDPKIKWKCLECDLMICQKCRDNVHSKFASAEDHTIIDIQKISEHQIDSTPKTDLEKIKCEIHKEQNCFLSSKSCSKLVCQTCITQKHNKHEFGDITNEFKIKIEKMKNGQKNIGHGIQTFTVSEQILKQIKFNEQSNYDKVKQEILDYEKDLIHDIKKHTSKLLKDLDQKWVDVSKFIDREERNLKKTKSQSRKQMQDINNLLQSNNPNEIFSVSTSLFKSIETVPYIKTTFQGVPKFTQGDKTKIRHNLAKLEDVKILYSSELQVKKKVKTELKNISFLEFSPDGSLWVCNPLTRSILKITLRKNLRILSHIKMEVDDAACLFSGDLLLSTAALPSLVLIPFNTSNAKESVYSVSPLLPSAVHVTFDNNVIVGAVNTDAIYATGPRQVIVMNQAGHHEKVFQFDKQDQPLFTYPHRITSNSRGHIAVGDWVSNSGQGRVIIFGKEGEVRNIYTGHPGVNDERHPFRLSCITTTPSDNFVVADFMSHYLHVLNRDGEIIICYNTEEIGILSFSTDGDLYIGCGTYETSEEKAKLYIVNKFVVDSK